MHCKIKEHDVWLLLPAALAVLPGLLCTPVDHGLQGRGEGRAMSSRHRRLREFLGTALRLKFSDERVRGLSEIVSLRLTDTIKLCS